jgi:hypothetical protein
VVGKTLTQIFGEADVVAIWIRDTFEIHGL